VTAVDGIGKLRSDRPLWETESRYHRSACARAREPDRIDMAKRLRIALLVGSSRTYRRELLCGIADYARTHGPWSFYHQERAPSDAVPAWLKDWNGDGIIAQIQSGKLARKIREMNLPTVDLFGLHDIEGIPAFDSDYDALAQMAADHLLEPRSLRLRFQALRFLRVGRRPLLRAKRCVFRAVPDSCGVRRERLQGPTESSRRFRVHGGGQGSTS